MMESITEDEIELEEIDSDETSEGADDESLMMVCSLCKTDMPSSETVDHLKNHHQIQRFSALESLLNLGIIMKAKNNNPQNSTERRLASSLTPNISTKIRNVANHCFNNSSNLLNKEPSSGDNIRVYESPNIGKSNSLSLAESQRVSNSIEDELPNYNLSKSNPNIELPENKYCHSMQPKPILPPTTCDINGSMTENKDRKFSPFEELSIDERKVCAQLRILPDTYDAVKSIMIKECQKRNGIKAGHVRKLIKMDVNKTTKLYYHFLQHNLIYKPLIHSPTDASFSNEKSNKITSFKLGATKSDTISSNLKTSSNSKSVAAPKPMKSENSNDPLYAPGELVLAHMKGYPWWPSIITNGPSLNATFDNNWYFVLFVDGKKNDIARIHESEIKAFIDYDDYLRKKKKGTRPALLARMRKANKCAQELKLWTNDRRLEYFVEANKSTENLFQNLMVSKKLPISSIETNEPKLVSPLLSTDVSSITNVASKPTRKRIKKRFGKRSLRHKHKKNIKSHVLAERIKPNFSQHQRDKDAISIEEDNDIVSIVNELLNELYS